MRRQFERTSCVQSYHNGRACALRWIFGAFRWRRLTLLAIGLTFKPTAGLFYWDRSDLGLAVAAFQVVSAIAMFVAGFVADRVGHDPFWPSVTLDRRGGHRLHGHDRRALARIDSLRRYFCYRQWRCFM